MKANVTSYVIYPKSLLLCINLLCATVSSERWDLSDLVDYIPERSSKKGRAGFGFKGSLRGAVTWYLAAVSVDGLSSTSKDK